MIVRERHGDRRPDRRLAATVGGVVVGEPDGSDPAPIRRAVDVSWGVPPGLADHEARGGREPLAVYRHRDGGRGNAVKGGSGVGAPGENLLEVERLPERLDEPRAHGVLAHAVDRRRDLAGQRVHPLADREQSLVEHPLGEAARTDDHRGDHGCEDDCRNRGDECEGGGAHRRCRSLLGRHESVVVRDELILTVLLGDLLRRSGPTLE